jgi:hypothetical protein
VPQRVRKLFVKSLVDEATIVCARQRVHRRLLVEPHHRVLLLLVHHAESEAGVRTKLQQVSLHQGRPLHAPALQEGAIAGVEILNKVVAARVQQERMPAAHAFVRQAEVGAGTASDQELWRLQREDLPVGGPIHTHEHATIARRGGQALAGG